MQLEIIQHHGSRQDRTDWIGNILSSSLRIRTMNGLEQSRDVTNGSRRHKPQRTIKCTCFMADNISKHILCKDYIKLFGVYNDLHGRIISKHIIDCNIRILGGYFLYHLSPKARCFHHVCLIN